MAGRFFPLDIDMGADSEEVKKLSAKDSKSKLAKPIQVNLETFILGGQMMFLGVGHFGL